MEPLLTRGWDAIHSGIQRAEHVLVATDFDGTLAPIVARPEMARLTESDRQVLKTIAGNPEFSVAIVTGRQMEEIRDLVQIDGAYYAANYGMEIDGPNSFRFREPTGERARSLIAALAPELDKAVSDISGAVVENKTLSITVHHRNVEPELVSVVSHRVRALTDPGVSAGTIRVREGNRKAIEVVPTDANDKGKAIGLILDRIGEIGARPWPIYLGDDVMDEDGFRVVNDLGGVSVLVGAENPAATEAQFSAVSTNEISHLIGRIAAVSQGQPWR
jgi:trehalose-phosphatase